jgi:hypothetical protein
MSSHLFFFSSITKSVVPAIHTIATLFGKKNETLSKSRNKRCIFEAFGHGLPVAKWVDNEAVSEKWTCSVLEALVRRSFSEWMIGDVHNGYQKKFAQNSSPPDSLGALICLLAEGFLVNHGRHLGTSSCYCPKLFWLTHHTLPLLNNISVQLKQSAAVFHSQIFV